MNDWWNKNLPHDLANFEKSIGDCNAVSKVYVRKYVREKNYKSILDAGCGLCSEYVGYKNDGYDIDYLGVDFCDYLIDQAKTKSIPVIKSSIESINLLDSSKEIVYGRHVLEHQSYYEKSLNEFIRIAQKEVIIVFFIWPTNEKINYDAVANLYNNQYDLCKLTYFLLYNPKVNSVQFEKLEYEIILHIYLKRED